MHAPLLFIYYNKTHNELTHPRETRKRKSRDTVGTMPRDFMISLGVPNSVWFGDIVPLPVCPARVSNEIVPVGKHRAGSAPSK